MAPSPRFEGHYKIKIGDETTKKVDVHRGRHNLMNKIRNTSYMAEDGVTVYKSGNEHTGYEYFIEWDGLVDDIVIKLV